MTTGEIVDEYYRRIDSNDLDWVVSLFSEDATYVRADSRLQGKAEIDKFFRTQRRIRGKHVIDSIVAVGDQVFCKGEFIGKGGDGRQAPGAVLRRVVFPFGRHGAVEGDLSSPGSRIREELSGTWSGCFFSFSLSAWY